MKPAAVTIHVKIDKDAFRRFGLFDTFRLKRRWRQPLMFSLILLAFAACCFVVHEKDGAIMLGCVLMSVALGLPAVYVGMFLSQLNAQAKKLRLDTPRPAYTLVMERTGVTVTNDMKAEEPVVLKWKQFAAAYRRKGCIYLYVNAARAFLLPDGQADVSPDELWAFLCGRMEKTKLHE